MAVPKRKTSRSNTRKRRSQWKATPVELMEITVDGVEQKIPRRLQKAFRLGLVK